MSAGGALGLLLTYWSCKLLIAININLLAIGAKLLHAGLYMLALIAVNLPQERGWNFLYALLRCSSVTCV
jgi:hypothetical protein